MNSDHEKRPQRISIPIRVVSGLLAIGGAFALSDILQRGTRPDGIAVAAFAIVSCIFCIVLFSYVSIWGKQPGWLDQAASAIDRELTQEATRAGHGWVLLAGAIFAFSAVVGFLFWLLANDYVLEKGAHQRSVVYIVFFLVWFVMVVLFGWYAKHRFDRQRKKGDSNTNGPSTSA